MRRPSLSALALLALTGSAAVSGCGRFASATSVPATPLATVNGVDIRQVTPSPGPVEQSRVEAVIDNQLLHEEALRKGLGRDPVVQRAIAQATSDIMARAYLNSTAAALPAPTPAEIDAYLAAHADLFGERKRYLIDQLVLASEDFTPQLKQRIDGAKSIAQVASWLDARKVPYTRAKVARNSAELAPPLLERLKTMPKGQLFVVVDGPHSTLDALLDVTPDPVPAALARNEAAVILQQEKRTAAEQGEIKRLRTLAKIDYFKPQQDSVATASGALASQPMEKQ
jgi:peptidyl-prolyl cis-trans isomerase C